MRRDPTNELPTALRAFLDKCIESVEQLEILLALRRSGRASAVRQVAADVGLSDSVVRHHLEQLAGCGLLDVKLGAEDVMYRYDAVADDLREGVDLLAEHYTRSRSALLRTVTDSKRRSLRHFAAAFRIWDSK